MAVITISNLNQIEEAADDDVLAIDDISAEETKKIPLESLQGNNILINQNFSIWQENTTFTNPANGVYTADGYFIQKSDGDGTAPSVNIKKNTSVHEDAFEQSCELEITNVGVQGTTVRWYVAQKIKGYKKYRGKNVTCAIRLKASTAISLSEGKLSLYDGVSGANADITSIGTDWITHTVTLAVSVAADRLELRFQLIPTGAGTISATGSIYIQWITINPGQVAKPPVPRLSGVDLMLSQRQCQKSYAQGTFPGAAASIGAVYRQASGFNSSDHTIYVDIKFPVVMDAAPTVTIYDVAGNSGKVSMAAGNNIAGTVSMISDSGFRVNATNGAASTSRKIAFQYFAVARP